jgi:hypothetical protein
LQEIKSETSKILIAEQARRESSARSADASSAEIQNIYCPGCRQQNPPGNRFCGKCGATIHSVHSDAGNGSVNAVSRAPSVAPRGRSEGEVEWMRDRNLGPLYEFEEPARQGWKYGLGVLAIALAIFAYLQWPLLDLSRFQAPVSTRSRQTSVAASPRPVGSAPAAPPPAAGAVPSVSLPTTANAPEERRAPAFPQTQPGLGPKATPEKIQPVVQTTSPLANTPPSRAADAGEGGNPDLRLAQRYLGGSLGARDSSEAAKLLWKAVRQQNTTAAILLSELYERGDGVAKSCDQARLLLVAAAKRGAPQAAEQLRHLELRGCS